jgi:hypothetical protein
MKMQLLKNLPPYLSIDLETSGLYREAEIITAAMSWSYDGGNTVLSEGFYLDRYGALIKPAENIFIEILAATLFNPGHKGVVIFHNAAFDLPLLIRRFFRIVSKGDRSKVPADPINYIFRLKDFCQVFDTQALSRSLRNNKYISHSDPRMERCHSLKFLAREYLAIDHKAFRETIGDSNIRFSDLDALLNYNRKDTELTLRLFFHLKKIAEQRPTEWACFEKMESPFIMAIIGLNWRGLPFNAKRANELSNLAKTEMFRLESEIHAKTGRNFNLQSSAELASAIFGNANLTYATDSGDRRLQSLYESETGLQKVDIDTLVKLRRRCNGNELNTRASHLVLNQIIQYLELAEAFEGIEKLQRHAVQMSDGTHRVFSKITVEAKTGRIKCGSPNVLGIAKQIFSESKIDSGDAILLEIGKYKSVRSLISVGNPDFFEIFSIDISGLDLGVITAGLLKHDMETYWKKCFDAYGPDSSLSLDTHLAILRRIAPSDYQAALIAYAPHLGISEGHESQLLDYWTTKERTETILGIETKVRKFIHIETGKVLSVPTTLISQTDQKSMRLIRETMKTTNLAIPYNQGATKLARDLTDKTGTLVTEFEARDRLESYHRIFPEIRAFQDSIANAVYHDGFIQSPFGRIIYADVFDELNLYYRDCNTKGHAGTYEFLLNFKGKFCFVRAEGWQKDRSPVIEKLKLKRESKVLNFAKIQSIQQLDRRIFRAKQQSNNSKFTKKSESNLLDQGKFEENVFSMTHEVDRLQSRGSAWDDESEQIRANWCINGTYVIPENSVLFYRVKLPNPSSLFFRTYKSLLKVARPFFATYCQAEATMIAKASMNYLQHALEERDLNAWILFFIHDQFDVVGDRWDAESLQAIMNEAIEFPKESIFPNRIQYPIKFFGDFVSKGEFFS